MIFTQVNIEIVVGKRSAFLSQCADNPIYRQVSNIRRTLVGNKIVDHSDVGAAPTASSFSI